MPTVGPGVCEVRIHRDGKHQVIYVAKFRFHLVLQMEVDKK